MRIVTCASLVVVISVFTITAQATWPVCFYVDTDMVAELQAESPFTGPIKLAGRSGPGGDHERSGLFDNVSVCWERSAGGLCYEAVDDGYGMFDVLDPGFWGLYGGPSPHLLEDFGNPVPCLMTSGDASYASGVYQLWDATLGNPWQVWWHFGVDVYVDSTADFHTVEFGIGDASAPSGPPGQQTLGHVVGVTWTSNAEGENVLQCVTDIDYVEVPAEQWIGGWHSIWFCGPGFTPVEGSSWGRVKALFR